MRLDEFAFVNQQLAGMLTPGIPYKGASEFLKVLATWREELDAAAFQQEQVATHPTAAFLVPWSGILVGAITISVFQCLTRVTNPAASW